jgi:niacin transporter
MTKKLDTKNMVITALLIAFGIIIPTAFGFLRVVLPPAFTATLTAHVPIIIAMFISPASAVFTAIGTAIGFFVAGLDLVVVIRAASHIIFAIVGAYMLRKRSNILIAGVVTAVLHALCEAIVVYIFLAMGWTTSSESFIKIAFYTNGIGTLVHHTIDFAIAIALLKALAKTGAVKNLPKLI